MIVTISEEGERRLQSIEEFVPHIDGCVAPDVGSFAVPHKKEVERPGQFTDGGHCAFGHKLPVLADHITRQDRAFGFFFVIFTVGIWSCTRLFVVVPFGVPVSYFGKVVWRKLGRRFSGEVNRVVGIVGNGEGSGGCGSGDEGDCTVCIFDFWGRWGSLPWVIDILEPRGTSPDPIREFLDKLVVVRSI